MDQNKLIDLAWKARENAYVPYSHFKVGACIALKDGTFVQGCNIEMLLMGQQCVQKEMLSLALIVKVIAKKILLD